MRFLLSKDACDEAIAMGNKATVVVAIWFLLVCGLAFGGKFEPLPGRFPVAVLAGFAIPILLFLVVYRLSNSLRKLVCAIDLPLATAFQAWRFGGLGFLGLYAHGVLPGFFAWPAGVGDITVGVVAPWLALRLERERGFAKSRTLAIWNVFGLLDFAVAMATGVMCSGIATEMFGLITTAPMSQLPLVFIPVFFVPLYSVLHIVGLLQISESD